jgi:hypothetical protein
VLAERWIIQRKEDITMTYSKPEVVALGEAVDLVQYQEKIAPFVTEVHTENAAYDLDE